MSGSSASSGSGAVSIGSADGGSSGGSGDVSVQSGEAQAGSSGKLVLGTGASAGGQSGAVSVSVGASGGGAGGSLAVKGGTSSAAGGAVFAQDVSPHFNNCTWLNNSVVSRVAPGKNTKRVGAGVARVRPVGPGKGKSSDVSQGATVISRYVLQWWGPSPLVGCMG